MQHDLNNRMMNDGRGRAREHRDPPTPQRGLLTAETALALHQACGGTSAPPPGFSAAQRTGFCDAWEPNWRAGFQAGKVFRSSFLGSEDLFVEQMRAAFGPQAVKR